jgi:hypothetical protein
MSTIAYTVQNKAYPKSFPRKQLRDHVIFKRLLIILVYFFLLQEVGDGLKLSIFAALLKKDMQQKCCDARDDAISTIARNPKNIKQLVVCKTYNLKRRT